MASIIKGIKNWSIMRSKARRVVSNREKRKREVIVPDTQMTNVVEMR